MKTRAPLESCICIAPLACVLTLLTVGASTSLGATLNVPADYATIQAAIDAASNSDTVMVAAGTYYGNLVWQSKVIALIGAGREVTTICGDTEDTDADGLPGPGDGLPGPGDGLPGPGSCLYMLGVPAGAEVRGFTFARCLPRCAYARSPAAPAEDLPGDMGNAGQGGLGFDRW